MNLDSNKIPLIILAITSLVCSRALFFFFKDPEGPNLLIVTVAAAVIYGVSLGAYRLSVSMGNSKRLLLAIVVQIAFVGGLYALNAYDLSKKQVSATADYKDIEYRINGATVKLTDGFSEVESAPGSQTKITTRYFGNEYMADFDNDGRDDVVFLLTQDTGGSGFFYFAVAALNTSRGYVGSDGYLLGDRIAPQTIEKSTNPRHVNVIVVNYADRAADEPMAAQPTISKSAYLKLDVSTMMWGIVEPHFEGEAR